MPFLIAAIKRKKVLHDFGSGSIAYPLRINSEKSDFIRALNLSI